MTRSVTTSGIDYLQRTGERPTVIGGPYTAGGTSTRRLLRVRGIGRPEKDQRARYRTSGDRDAWRPPTTELLTGLYGYRIPVAFSIVGSADGVDVQIGTWSAKEGAADVQDRRAEVLTSVLRGLYPIVDLEHGESVPWSWPLSGFALGVPSGFGIDDMDGSSPIDRIIRSLQGADWEALVLAHPVSDTAISSVREQVINDVREVEEVTRAEGAISPLATQYVGLLEVSMAAAAEALATGGWRTAVYLLGDGDTYPRLASAWRSAFSGDRSLPEPIRVFDSPEADALAQQWGMPDQAPAAGPRHYTRPYELQTLLTTAQLATYVHLPELETPGYSVRLATRFDAVPSAAHDDGQVSIGTVQHGGRDTATNYRVGLDSLTRHAFVGGLTGSGKTNTIFSLLLEADRAGVPFLVIEPAKTEYRALLHHPDLGARLRVFTAGRSTVSPLLLNPFEVPPGTGVAEHLDLLRAAFAAGFGMWTPLPQILERCLHEVYEDRGWDLRTNHNRRLADGDDPGVAFPTLTDLVTKVGEVVPRLGYDDRIANDLRAALTTRLQSLQAGGKGAMLDVARSIPIAELLSAPTVIELEAMADEGDKAFLTALLVIRLVEHRRATGQAEHLTHLLVIEEAHRLLSNVSTHQQEGEANPRGQAVETFSNLLSEIRAYGQGVIVADQVPVRLAPDVMKNTSLKIAHRTVADDDRRALAGSMAMTEEQSRALTTLAPGQAAVFSTGDDAPLLVQVALAKGGAISPPPDATVGTHMARWRAAGGVDALLLARASCAETCVGALDACAAAREAMADEYVQRTVSRIALSAGEDAAAVDRLWDDLLQVVRPRRPAHVAEPALLRSIAGHAAEWLAGRRGAQAGWSYADTAALDADLRSVLLDKLEPRSKARTAKLRAAYQATNRRLHVRTYAPYAACDLVCRDGTCRYRWAAADLVAGGRYHRSWYDADEADLRADDGARRATWNVCQDAGYELIQFPEPDAPPAVNEPIVAAARRVCVCFGQQMLADDERKVPRTSRRILARIVDESGL